MYTFTPSTVLSSKNLHSGVFIYHKALELMLAQNG